MFRQAIVVVVAVVAVFAALPAFAQWQNGERVDDFSDEVHKYAFVNGDKVRLMVACFKGEIWGRSGYTLSISLVDDGIFHDGEIEVRWDNGEVEKHFLEDENTILYADDFGWLDDQRLSFASVLVTKLMLYSELRLRVRSWPDTRVTDRISLIGSTRAIEALSCKK